MLLSLCNFLPGVAGVLITSVYSQSFQHSVCENSGRVNNLLQRGEELLQRSESADAQHVESRLLELLRRCSHVYNNIARTHTRLLSMRLVYSLFNISCCSLQAVYLKVPDTLGVLE